MSQTPKVVSRTELSPADAKWITLKKLKYIDAEGRERFWECAERRTRKSTGIDAVAILAVIKSKTNSFPPSTIAIEQYRPPIDKFVIELPAGLIDEGETPEQAAIRELEEETGLKADSIVESSPVVVSDPGMTNANMKLVILKVTLEDKLELPDQKLEQGEFIVRKVISMDSLYEELKEYDKKGFVLDARLQHFAAGYALAQKGF
ncbi:adp-ribose pyrophosphatase [Moniliophthora roreri MCA 2997]|uniref:Adp-ribose pyrophosphatase n=1 Tax=Moniliophthora roreri (strain MCA 2997) TaxID=1381753 RepID=V2XVB5_MONRO|nr:adp-ribose pyrophosphatase [Moniliophthora roreri MCA 2997]